MYSKIYQEFWNDDKINTLSIDGRYLMLYFLTCPHRNVLGCFKLPKSYVSEDTQLKPRKLTKLMNECLDLGLVEYDEKSKVIFIKNFLKYNPIENPNQAEGARKRLKNEPNSPLFVKVAEILIKQKLDSKEAYKLIDELTSKGDDKQLAHKQDMHVKKTKESEQNSDITLDELTQKETPKKVIGGSHENMCDESIGSTLAPNQKKSFQIFWDVYPRKIGMGRAERAWKKLNPDGILVDKILAAVNRAIKLDYRFRTERYTPHPGNWLNEKGWLSEYTGKQGTNTQRFGQGGERDYTQEQLDEIFGDPLGTVNEGLFLENCHAGC